MKALKQKIKTKLFSDKLIKNLVKKSSGPFGIQILGMICAYIFAILLTRIYGAEVFGLYSLAMVVSNIASIISRFGTDTAAVKLLPSFIFNNEKDKVIGFYLRSLLLVTALSTVLSYIIYIIASWLSIEIFKKPDLVEHIKMLAISTLPFSVIQLNAEVLRAYGKTNFQSAFKTLLFPLIGVISIILIVFLNSYKIDISVLYLWTSTIICFLSFFLLIPLLGKDIKYFHFDTVEVDYNSILKIAAPMMLFSSTLLISEWVNTLMLGAMGTAQDIGIYKVISRISAINVVVLTAVNTVIAPNISKVFAEGKMENLQENVQKATKLIFWASLPLQIILFATGPFLLSLFGKDFVIGLIPLYLVLIGQLFNSMSGPVAQVLNMTNGQVFLSWISSIRIVLAVVLNYFLIPTYGLVGLAASILLSRSLTNIISVYRIKKTLGFYPVYGLWKQK